MKFKREIIAIMLVICMLFTISAISAADSSDDTVSVTNQSASVVNVASDDSIGMQNDGEILGDGEIGTFEELYAEINEDTSKTYIELEKNYHGSYDKGKGIQINRANVVIDGKGHTIDCTGENSRMFYITSEGITLKNIIFIGGNVGYGGAVYTNKYLTIINCTFKDNQATGTGSAYGGGAIYCSHIKIDVYNSTFINNSAAKNGGAICAAGSNSGSPDDIYISNCTFINNRASNNGGAFYSYANENLGQIINSTFIKNQATSYGSAIYNYGSYGTIDGCIFMNETANTCVIYTYNYMTVQNSIFLDNNANYILYASYPVITANNNWFGNSMNNYVDSPKINDNTINNWYVLDLTVNHQEHKITVSLNNLYNAGEIIFDVIYNLPKINVTIKGTNIDINKEVTINETGKVTVDYEPNDGYTVTVSCNGVDLISKEIKPSFSLLNDMINNGESNSIDLDNDFEFDLIKDGSLTDGILIDKELTIDGHGHYIDAKDQARIFNFIGESKDLILKNIIFLNAKGENGGAVYFNGNKIEIINCTFENNAASNNGDAVYISGINEDSKIDQSTFINNKGSVSTVYVNSADKRFDVTNSIFLNNTDLNIKASGNVVAEYNWFGHNTTNYADENVANVEGVTLSNWLFLNITAADAVASISLNNLNNGDIYSGYSLPSFTLDVDSENITADTSVTIDNTGVGKLNYAIQKTTGSLNVYYGDFSNTESIDFVDDGSFTALQLLIDSTPERTVLKLERDYTYDSSKDSALVDGITFSKNIAIYGYNHKIDANKMARLFMVTQTITFRDILFVNGKALNGAVVNANGGNCRFINCSFINNTASNNGGVVYNSVDNTLNQFENCTFINNRATNGGVINNYKGIARFIDSTFINNSANSGGVYRSEYYGYCMIDNCTFVNNSAKMGAVINSGNYGTTYDEYIINSKFFGNRVTTIDSSYSTYSIIATTIPTVEGCIFINNTGASSIFYGNKAFTVENSVFLDNSAKYILNSGTATNIVANYNWFGNTLNNYDEAPNVLPNAKINNWFYLDAKLHSNYADIYLNKLYVKSGSGDFEYNLPEITLNINSSSLNLNCNNVTLDANGQAKVYYDFADSGAITLSYGKVSLTKEYAVGDFDILQDLIDGDESGLIELDRNYNYIFGVDSIINGIVIGKNITIDGKGHTINANGYSRIFDVQAVNVTFKNIKFANASCSQGASINLQMDNSEAVELNVINCTFENSSGYSGGAIYILSNVGNYTIKDSTFINGDVTGFGGAIYINTKNAEFNLYNSTFSNNKALNGGAVYVETNNTEIAIDKCLFKENIVSGSSSSYGNAILWKSANDNGNVIKNSIFIDNGNYKTNYYAFAFISGEVNIDENWWGTTAQNKPDELYSYYIGGMTPNSWLYINGTENTFYVGENSPLKFVLKLYDNDTKTFHDYDNTKLPYLNFSVSSENNYGTIDKSVVALGEEFSYAPTQVGADSITTYLNNIIFQFKITNRGHSIITSFLVDTNPFIMYFNQHLNFDEIAVVSQKIKSYIKSNTSNDSVVAPKGGVGNTNDINAKSSGTAIFTIYYDGIYKDYYDTTSVDIPVNVLKVPMEIQIANLNNYDLTIYAKDHVDLNITIHVDDYYGSFLRANGNNLKYKIEVIDSEDNCLSFSKSNTWTTPNPNVNGTGQIYAVYYGNAILTLYYDEPNVECENVTIMVHILKIPTQIDLDHSDNLDYKVDDVSKINATLNDTSAYQYDRLTYVSSNSDIIEILNANTGEFKAKANGTATITVNYAGSDQYADSTKNITVTVTKHDSEVSLVSNNITPKYLQTITVTPTVTPSEATGTITYYIGETPISQALGLTDEFKFTVDRVGEFNITAKYSGDYKYGESEKNITITSTKAGTSVKVEVTTETYPDNVTVTVTSIVSGTYTIDVNGTVITVTIPKGETTASVSHKFGAGNYCANITGVPSDERYEVTTYQNDTFTVGKGIIGLSIALDEIEYGKNITGNITTNAAGTYTVKIADGEEFTVEAGVGVTPFTVAYKLPVANGYRAVVNISTGANYTEKSAQNTFNVIKTDSEFNVTSKETYVYGEKAVLTIQLPDDATGSVVFKYANGTVVGKIDDVSKASELSLGIFDVEGYEIYANYSGDSNYMDSYKQVIFNVVKADNNIEVTVIANSYPNEVLVKVTADVAGIYRVNINGTYIDVEANSTGVYHGFAAGSYFANTTYTDKNYNGVIKNTTFTLLKGVAVVVVDVDDVTYNDDAIIRVISNIPGVYTVTINETYHVDVVVGSSGEGSSQINLAVGKSYVASTSFEDYENYTVFITNASFDVNKADNNIKVIVSDVDYPDEVNISVEADIEGTYTVNINGTLKDIVANGDGINLKLAFGDYWANVTGYVSENYNGIITNKTFKVNKAINIVKVIVDKYSYDGKATIRLEADVDGKYTVKIGDALISVDVISGIGENTTSLPEGEYDTETHFIDTNYTSIVREATFKVLPAGVKGNLTIRDINAPLNTTITVTGEGSVTVAFEYYFIKADEISVISSLQYNGMDIMPIKEETFTRYEFTLTQSGVINVNITLRGTDYDDNPYELTSNTLTYNVIVKAPDTRVKVDLEEVCNIEIPQGTTSPVVNVTLPQNATGNITITIDGKSKVNKSLTNGFVSISLGELTGGKHNITIAYTGDGNYTEAEFNTTVNIGKEIIPENKTSFDITIAKGTTSPVVNVGLPSDAEGNVTVTVDGEKTYNATLKGGAAVINIPELAVGEHSLSISYSGDDKYDSLARNITLDVPKVDLTDIVKIDTSLAAGAKSPTITVTLPSDATGYVVMDVNGKQLYVPVKDTKATLNVGALTYGNNKIGIKYYGDDRYSPVNKTINVNVPKPVLTVKNKSVRYSSVVKYQVRLTVSGKALTGKYVYLKYNGKNTKSKN